jgi:uncharacterized protein
MIIKITGASGYLGKIISEELENRGHSIFPLKRNFLYGPTSELKNELKGADAVIHLAGAPVLKRWTAKNRQVIYDSRVQTTRNLVTAIQEMNPGQRPQKICSASAVGIYAPGKTHDESSTEFDDEFVGKVVQDWEAAWNDLPEPVRRSIFRIGVVLGKDSETIKKIWWPLKLGVGGKIGNGKQPFPFIHEKDVARAFALCLENQKTEGIFNLVAPQKISNKTFTKTLAKQLHRPACLPVPGLVLKLIFGKAASLLLESPEVEPRRLMDAGFHFHYPTIDEAIKEIIG